MKGWFNRVVGKSDKSKDQNSVASKEKFPPLRPWPPPAPDPPRSPTTPAMVPNNFKPLPELVPAQIASQLNQPQREPTPPPPPLPIKTASSQESTAASLSPEPERPEKMVRRNTKDSTKEPSQGDQQNHKKVAFISPPPTPTPTNFDRPLTESTLASSPVGQQQQQLSKTPVSRFQATYGKEPRASPNPGTPASSSRTDLSAVAANKNAAKATSTRTASSPYMQRAFEAASAPSLRSGTPYSSMSQNTSGSRILAAQSWSEVTEGDLVSNIGSRERTRQEVLFEIIQSEDRYVQELIKFKDTFIDPLLHPYATSVAAVASTPNLEYDYYRPDSPAESAEELPPIAARFMSPTPGHNTPHGYNNRSRDTPAPEPESIDSDEEDPRGPKLSLRKPAVSSSNSKHDHPRSPYRLGASRSGGRASASTHSLGRQSTIVEEPRDRKLSHGQHDAASKSGVLRKFKKSTPGVAEGILGNTLAPNQLPEDLRICLEVIDSGVFDGHKKLSDALRKRYDDQYPLVRSLADVFVSNADIFSGYARYVLHLERALEQVDAALSNVSTKKPKKQDAAEWTKVCKVLQKLEENAVDKGETGLAITLSKPFQRLLKYPLLCQNLLFHTDPSTFEYESTLQMVAEVENIIRSIEDEKIQKEERDKTRDVFARIEGLDKVRQLALPKPSRVLVDERPCAPGSSPLSTSPKPNASSPPPVSNNKGVRGKSSFKRLSDVLQSSGVGGKKDMWFVVFNDVVLQCQRTGTTSLPLVATLNSRANSLPDFQGKAKYATTGRRNSYTKPRNLYKFIKIETWTIAETAREGVVSMDDVARTRSQTLSSQPRIIPMPDDKEDSDDGDSSDSDKKSKMSFSYWGADKITVQKPVMRGKTSPAPRRGAVTASYGRESSANAKFGTRLVSDGSNPRPAGRRPGSTTPAPRPRPATSTAIYGDDGPNYSKSTVTRPAWDTSTRALPAGAVVRRVRNTSQASRTTVNQTPVPVKSPATSEDSGA